MSVDNLTKRCPRCGETKQCSEFNRSSSSRSGLQCWCKLCRRVTQRKLGAAPRLAQLIPEFPKEVDRREFGNWLSGFTDGEGHFGLRVCRRKPRPERLTSTTAEFVCEFAIALRADDTPILRQIQAFFGCGRLCTITNRNRGRSKPITEFFVTNINDLATVIVPHFDLHPLRAKKSRDFIIWKQGVAFVKSVTSRPKHWGNVTPTGRQGPKPRWNPADIEEFVRLVDQLKGIRSYADPC